MSGARTRFAVITGGGAVRDPEVITGPTGLAGTTWTLGDVAGRQLLEVSVIGTNVPSLTITADAVPRSSADYLALALHSATVLMLSVEPGTPSPSGGPLVDVSWHRVAGGLLRMLPRDASMPDDHLVLLTMGHPPLVVRHQWQPRPETLSVAFLEPFRVPLTIWAMGDFAALSARVEADLGATSRLWANHSFGLQIGDVDLIDASEHQQTAINCGSVPFEKPETINIYYSAAADALGFVGYACSQSRILIRPVLTPGTMLLAHELGHTFGLGHMEDTGNFMHPSAVGGSATIGQIYAAHFYSWSALNQVYSFRSGEDLWCCAVGHAFNP